MVVANCWLVGKRPKSDKNVAGVGEVAGDDFSGDNLRG